jgi:hypothetical protein
MKHEIAELDSNELRRFAITTAAALTVLFGIVLPWLFEFSFPKWPWIASAVLVVWGLAAPSTLRLVYRAWMRVSLLISSVTTPLVLGIVYYLVILPAALIMRMIGMDPMRRKFEKEAGSYKIVSEKPSRENMERPF